LPRPVNVSSSTPLPRNLPAVAGLAALLTAFAAQAQPSSVPPERYGDRQAGVFGNPDEGYFGNPGAGNFDSNSLKLPPVGAQPMGRVYQGGAVPLAPYLSLPGPVDAAKPVDEEKKKPASPRASSKLDGKAKPNQ
jgi:hypothetical protein